MRIYRVRIQHHVREYFRQPYTPIRELPRGIVWPAAPFEKVRSVQAAHVLRQNLVAERFAGVPHVRLAVENRLAVGYRLQIARLEEIPAAGGRAYGIQASVRLVDIDVVSVQEYRLEANCYIRAPVGLADYFSAVFAQIRK